MKVLMCPFQLNDSDNFDKIAIMNQIKKWSLVLKATNQFIESTGKNCFEAFFDLPGA